MDAPEVARAVDAALSIVSAQGLPAEDASVVWNSNKLSLRIDPCAVFARVALVGREVAALEIELAERLAQVDAPAGVLDPRVEPRVHERDGFAITLWTFHDSRPADLAPTSYAEALHRLHAGMRQISVTTPHFTDRVAEAEGLLSNRALTPDLGDANRTLLVDALADVRRAIGESGATEQLVHGEPHPGNVLDVAGGPRFIDLETCCVGPVEFDLAHVPKAVADAYPDADHDLLDNCRRLVLAMVAVWRFERDDQFPNREQAARDLLGALRSGPPWPTLDSLIG